MVVNAKAIMQAVDELEPLAVIMPSDAVDRQKYVICRLRFFLCLNKQPLTKVDMQVTVFKSTCRRRVKVQLSHNCRPPLFYDVPD